MSIMAIEIGILLGIMISAMQKTNLQWQMINLTLTCKEKCTFFVLMSVSQQLMARHMTILLHSQRLLYCCKRIKPALKLITLILNILIRFKVNVFIHNLRNFCIKEYDVINETNVVYEQREKTIFKSKCIFFKNNDAIYLNL